MSAETVEQIRALGWRQCLPLPLAAHAVLSDTLKIDLPNDSICAVVSHSCDILQRKYEAEPFVEIAIGTKIAEVDGNFTAGKNPRRLHIAISGIGCAGAYEFLIGNRHQIPRATLADFAPDFGRHLSPECAAELINWIVLRYRRQAFPDEFQNRVGVHLKDLKAKAKAMTDIAALHIGLTPWSEIAEEAEYEVVLLGLVSDDVATDPVRMRAAQRAFYEFETGLAGIPGLFVNRDVSRVAAEDDVLVSELKLLPKWTDFDTVSLADQANHEIDSRPLLKLVC